MLKKYVWLMLFVVVPVYSMDQTLKIYGAADGEESAFEVSIAVLQLSKTLAGLIEDLGGYTESAIPVYNFSTKILRDLVELLNLYNNKSFDELEQIRKKVESYSTVELIDISNCANYLALPEEILNLFKDVINKAASKKKFKSSRHVPIGELNYDFTRYYMSPEIISEVTSYIKIIMLEKNMSDRTHFMRATVDNAKTYAPTGVFLNNDAWIAMSTVSGRPTQGSIIIFDAVTNNKLYILPLNFHATQLVACNNSYLACKERHGNCMRIFNLQDPAHIMHYDYRLPGRSIKSIEFSPNGSFLVLTTNNKKIAIIDMKDINWNTVPVSLNSAHVAFVDAPVGYSSRDKIFFSDDSICMVASMERKFINLSRADCLKNVVIYKAVPEEKADFRCCGFSRDGKRLAVLSDLGKKLKITVFDTENMKKIIEFNGPRIDPVYQLSIQFSPDGLWLVCIKSNSVSLYDSMTGERLGKINGLRYNKSMHMSSNGAKLLLAGSNSTLTDNCFGLVYVFLTPQEEEILKKISQCTLDQLQLIRDLCYALVASGSVDINEDSTAYTLFASLDQDIQQLLRKIGVKITRQTKIKKLLSRPKKG